MINMFISFEESFFIIFISILLFGSKKIPEIARNLGEGIRYFQNIIKKIKKDIWLQEKNKNKKNGKNDINN